MPIDPVFSNKVTSTFDERKKIAPNSTFGFFFSSIQINLLKETQITLLDYESGIDIFGFHCLFWHLFVPGIWLSDEWKESSASLCQFCLSKIDLTNGEFAEVEVLYTEEQNQSLFYATWQNFSQLSKFIGKNPVPKVHLNAIFLETGRYRC